MLTCKQRAVAPKGAEAVTAVDRVVAADVLDRTRQGRRVARGDVHAGLTIRVHPGDARARDARGHHGLAAGHRLDLDDAECLRLLDRAQAEHAAGAVVRRQVLVAHAAQELDLPVETERRDLVQERTAQGTRAANQDHVVVAKVAGGLDQVTVALVGDQAPQREHDLTAAVAGTDLGDAARLGAHRLHTDRQATALPLETAEERGTRQVDRGRTHDEVRTADQPALQRPVEVEQHALLQDVGMPVEHHATAVAGQPQRQAGHRVRVVHVDDVVAPADAAQRAHQRRGEHRRGGLGQRAAAQQLGKPVHALHAVAPLGRGAKHVAPDTGTRQTNHQLVLHLLHTALHRVELAQLKNTQFFGIHFLS